MYDFLEDLNKTSGINGSMLVGFDGIIIAADLGTGLEDDTIGALAASIISPVKKALGMLGEGLLKHVMIEADNGKIFLAENQFGILVVLAENEVNIGMIRLEMKSALCKLQKSPILAS